MDRFEQELVKGIRELPDEVWAQIIGDHFDEVRAKPEKPPAVIQKPPAVTQAGVARLQQEKKQRLSAAKRKKRHTPYTRLIVQDQRFVMWSNRKGWIIQDEKSRKGKTSPVIKVVGRTEAEARKRLWKALD